MLWFHIGYREAKLMLWQQHYRYWVLFRCPAVRFLDYQKVKMAEREKAAELFGTATEPSALASKVFTLTFIYYLCMDTNAVLDYGCQIENF